MTESLFDDRSHEPDEGLLTELLDARKPLWDAVLACAHDAVERLERRWSFYSKSSGWVLLLQRGKQTYCTLLPTAEELIAIFLLPERAVEAARESDLPTEVLESIDAARSYAQGRPFRVSLRDDETVRAFRTLLALKGDSFKKRTRA